MISARSQAGELVLAAELRPGEVAYLDADWLRPDVEALPALICDGELLRFGERSTELELRTGDAAAAAALEAVVQEVLRAVNGAAGPVEVTGSGVVARRLRNVLASGEDDGEIGTCVETTGDEAAIRSCTRRLRDLGTLVLAGESSSTVPLDLYPDVHARGLNVVGAAGPLIAEFSDGELPMLFAESLVPVAPGEPIPRGALWVRVTSQPVERPVVPPSREK